MGFNSGFKGLMQVLEIWIFGTDPWDCKSFPVKKGFRLKQVLLYVCVFITGHIRTAHGWSRTWIMDINKTMGYSRTTVTGSRTSFVVASVRSSIHSNIYIYIYIYMI